MNYLKLKSFNPTEYDKMINSKGQIIRFVEHPIYGDEFEVIAMCDELEAAGATGFFELDDMLDEHGEYEPWFDENKNLNIGNL